MNDDERPQLNGVEALLAELMPTLDPRRIHGHLFSWGMRADVASGEEKNDD